MPGPYRTHSTLLIARALLANPDHDLAHWNADLCQRTGLRSGTVSNVLSRFVQYGWLSRDGTGPSDVGGAPRRHLHITPLGQQKLPRFIEDQTEERP